MGKYLIVNKNKLINKIKRINIIIPQLYVE